MIGMPERQELPRHPGGWGTYRAQLFRKFEHV